MEEEFKEQVVALEQIAETSPSDTDILHIRFHAASGRGDLLFKEKNYEAAKMHYLRAIAVFDGVEKSHHDTWLIVYALNRLAILERSRAHRDAAQQYWQEALSIANSTQMRDRSILYMTALQEMALEDRDFESAYGFQQAILAEKAVLDSLSEGHDMEKYYMELEKGQLESEKATQNLRFNLQRNQLRSTIVIASLAMLLAFGLFIGLRRQRQGRQQLAKQYELISKQAEQLRQLDEAKSRFFANVSHELRTPLTLIRGPLKMLLQSNDKTAQHTQLLTLAKNNTDKLLRLVEDILDLRRLETGHLQLHLQAESLQPFFALHSAQFESLAKTHQVAYHVDVDSLVGKSAFIDPEKCRQILYNLLSNAFKHTPVGGKVTIQVVADEQQLSITVNDTGTGIHPDDLPHVFDRFFQTSQPNKKAEGGTGIGLALCKEYAQLFGGIIHAKSEPGVQTQFTVVFPITLVAHQQLVSTADSVLKVPYSVIPDAVQVLPPESPQVLLVEDNLELKQYLQLIISPTYRVVAVGNGQEAWQYLQSADQLPDVIISDLMMPVMDGYELLDRLKNNDATRAIPIIMLTARAESRDKLRALRIGVDDYLTKPFDEEELLIRMENLLGNQQMRKAVQQAGVVAPSTEEDTLFQEDKEWLEQFQFWVENNLADDRLSVSQMAHEFAMSDSTLFRQVTRLTGLSPSQYLQAARMQAARLLIDDRVHRSLTQVASKVGYANVRTFSRNYKAYFGVSPSVK
ncbi:MAG: response regulator [Saprospiraceae bacterium]